MPVLVKGQHHTGLPIIRTSVDHGTALELAGTGRANAEAAGSDRVGCPISEKSGFFHDYAA